MPPRKPPDKRKPAGSGVHGSRQSQNDASSVRRGGNAEHKKDQQKIGNPARRAGIADTDAHTSRISARDARVGNNSAERINIHERSGVSELRSQNARGQQNYGEHRGERKPSGVTPQIRQSVAKSNFAAQAERIAEENRIEETHSVQNAETAVRQSMEQQTHAAEQHDMQIVQPPASSPGAYQQAVTAQGGSSIEPAQYSAPAHSQKVVHSSHERAQDKVTAGMAAQQRAAAAENAPPDKAVRDAHRRSSEKVPKRRQERQVKKDLGKKREKSIQKREAQREGHKSANARQTLDRTGKRANKAEEIRERHKRAMEPKTAKAQPNAVRDRYAKAAIVRKNLGKQQAAKSEQNAAAEKAALTRSGAAAEKTPLSPGRKASGSNAVRRTPLHKQQRPAAKAAPEKTSRRPGRSGNQGPVRSARDIMRSTAPASDSPKSAGKPGNIRSRRGGISARALKAGLVQEKEASISTTGLARKMVQGRLKRGARTARELISSIQGGSGADQNTTRRESAEANAESSMRKGLKDAPKTAAKAAAVAGAIKTAVKARAFKKQTVRKLTERNIQRAQTQAKAQAQARAGAQLRQISSARTLLSARSAPALHSRQTSLRAMLAPMRTRARDLARQVTGFSRVGMDSTLSTGAQKKLKRLMASRSAYGQFGKRRTQRTVLRKDVAGKAASKRTAAAARKRRILKSRSTVRRRKRLINPATGRKTGFVTRRQFVRSMKKKAAKQYRAMQKKERGKTGGLKRKAKEAVKNAAVAALATGAPGKGQSDSATAKAVDKVFSMEADTRKDIIGFIRKLIKKYKGKKLGTPKLKKKSAEKMAERLAKRESAAKAAKAAGKAAGAGQKTVSGLQKAAQSVTKPAAAAGKTARVLRKSASSAVKAGTQLKRAGRVLKKTLTDPKGLVSQGSKMAMRAKKTVQALRGAVKGAGLPSPVASISKGIDKISGWKILPKIMRGNVLDRLKILLLLVAAAAAVFFLAAMGAGESKFITDKTGAAANLVEPDCADMRFEMEQKLMNEVINPLYYSYQGGSGNIVHIRYNANAGYAESYDDYREENYGDAVAIFTMKTDQKERVDREHFDQIWEVYKTINPVTVTHTVEEIDGELKDVIYIDVENWKIPSVKIQNRFGFSDEEMDKMVEWTQPPEEPAYWFNKMLGLDTSFWEFGAAGVGGDYLSMFAGLSPTEAVYRLLQECTKYDGWEYSQPKRASNGYRDCSSFVSSCYNIFSPSGRFFNEQYATTVGILQWCEQNNVFFPCSGSNYESVLQPGDIIFWKSNSGHYKGVGHVAIYTGNGMMWESAPSSHGVVHRAVSIQMPGKIMGLGRPLALAEKIVWDGTVLPMGDTGMTTPGAGTEVIVPSNFPQTGIVGDATPFNRENWGYGMGQIQQIWRSKGSPANGHFCMLDGKFMIATATTFGGCGDIITVKLDNGRSFQAVITDTKRPTDANSHRYGHIMDGKVSCIEFETTYNSSDSVNTMQLKKELQAMGIYGAKVVSVINHGKGYNVGS